MTISQVSSLGSMARWAGLMTALLADTVRADGDGLIGWGKHMYKPTCAFACRAVISDCPLRCTPTDGPLLVAGHHHKTTTPPDCFTSDAAFRQTMAVCIDTYCPGHGKPSLSMIEDYWASHLATGSIGDYRWVPSLSYSASLASAYDEGRVAYNSTAGVHGPIKSDQSGRGGMPMARDLGHDNSADSSPLTANKTSIFPTIRAKEPLNVTSSVAEEDWQTRFNDMYSFEINESGHSTYGRTFTWFKAVAVWSSVWPGNKKQREPVMLLGGLMGGVVPSRGQSAMIALVSLLNVVLLFGPVHTIQPQESYVSDQEQEIATIANRAGIMALANTLALVLFSARNNILVYLGDWSHGTFLLLHRWVGYWVILLTVIHSLMELADYAKWRNYAAESAERYWIWGVVGTVMVVAIVPTSLLALRQRAYEVFLSIHHLLAASFLIAAFLHIWYSFEYRWGYEIWIYVAGGIWGTDRLCRLIRIAMHGSRWVTVTRLPVADVGRGEAGEAQYLRLDVEGVHADGVVYLYFPTLTWRVWENHPFSVASSFTSTMSGNAVQRMSRPVSVREPEPGCAEKNRATIVSDLSATNAGAHHTPGRSWGCEVRQDRIRTQATVLVRVRDGITARLACSPRIRLPVLIDGSYRSPIHQSASDLARCGRLVLLAGGTGITALLPMLRTLSKPRTANLYWGLRSTVLLHALEAELAGFPASVAVETSVGPRIDVADVLRRELMGSDDGDKELVGVVVCGPSGMADDVRASVVHMTRQGVLRKAIVFVDEAYGW